MRLRALLSTLRAQRRARVRARAIAYIARDLDERGFGVDFSALPQAMQDVAIAAAHHAIIDAGAARGWSRRRSEAFFGRGGAAIARACRCRDGLTHNKPEQYPTTWEGWARFNRGPA